jgi:hypothetical protein
MLAASELMSWAEQTSTQSFEEAGEGDRNTVRWVSGTERGEEEHLDTRLNFIGLSECPVGRFSVMITPIIISVGFRWACHSIFYGG